MTISACPEQHSINILCLKCRRIGGVGPSYARSRVPGHGYARPGFANQNERHIQTERKVLK